MSAARERIYSSTDQAHPDEKQGQPGSVCRVSQHGKVHGAEMGTGPEKAKRSFIKAAEPGRGKRPGRVGLGKESRFQRKIIEEIPEHGINRCADKNSIENKDLFRLVYHRVGVTGTDWQ